MAWSPAKCLEQLDSTDKDFRFMALSDLNNELQKESFKVDTDNEKKIVNKLLAMIAEDSSGDVKGIAVRCIGPLAAKVQKANTKIIMEKLRDYLVDEKKDDEVRDIASSGLKGVISELPDSQVENMQELLKTVPARIVQAIAESQVQEVVEHALDVLDDVLKRWGKQVAADKALCTKATKAVVPQLTSSRSSNRKKAANCIARLSVTLPDELFAEVMDTLLKSIKESKKADHIRTFLSTIGSISRHAGFRLAKYLDQVVPILAQYSDHPKFKDDDDIRETCFQAFESIVLRCPKDADKFLDQILKLALKFMAHDPNFAGGSDDDDAMDVDEDEDFGGEDYDYSDDDDLSWKVRKAATRVLGAVIKTHPSQLNQIFDTAGAFLVKRFTEREENVKVDIYATFIELLHQVAIIFEHEQMGAGNTVIDKIKKEVPNMVKALVKDIGGKSEKTRVGAFQVLRELCRVVPGSLEAQIGTLVTGLTGAIDGKGTSAPIKIEALSFLRSLLQTHNPPSFHPHLAKLTPSVYKAVADKYTKISAEALLVCSELARIFPAKEGFDYAPLAGPLFNATLEKLKQQDIDQEVKEVAIECMGYVIALLGDKIGANVTTAVAILKDRLTNEVTRLVTVKTFEQIAQSKLKMDISAVLGDVIKSLASFLRQLNRQLKIATLTTLTSLVKAFGKQQGATENFSLVLSELAPLASDQDLHLAHLALKLAAAIVHVEPNAVATVKDALLGKLQDLLKSSFLQGMALESLLALYKELATANNKALAPEALLKSLLALGTSDKEHLSKQSFHSIAQAVAVLVVQNEAAKDATVTDFVNDVNKPKNDNSRLLSLFCIGEIGRRVDLSAIANIKKTVLSCFESPSEDVKAAASVSLGCLAVGKLRKFLPDILAEMKENPKRQYLLLGSVREAIVRLSSSTKGVKSLQKFLDQLLALLFEFTGTEEEGNRNVVAECLGKLALIDGGRVIVALKDRVGSPKAEVRACVATAIKSAIVEKAQAVDAVLQEHIAAFLDLIKDGEIAVRKAVLLSLNFTAHLKPAIVRELLPKYLPAVYDQTAIKKELIKEVEVGPFKHLIDTGIELRQAAFEALYTMLETCLTRLDVAELIQRLASALNDTYDIQMLAHLILARIAKKAGAALVSGLDVLIEPLRTAINSKPKGEAVQQQIERHDEMIRSTLRAIHVISKVEGIENAPHFTEFLTSAITGPLAEKYAAVVKEAAERQ